MLQAKTLRSTLFVRTVYIQSIMYMPVVMYITFMMSLDSPHIEEKFVTFCIDQTVSENS